MEAPNLPAAISVLGNPHKTPKGLSVQVATCVKEVSDGVFPLVKDNFAGTSRYLYGVSKLIDINGRAEVDNLALELVVKAMSSADEEILLLTEQGDIVIDS